MDNIDFASLWVRVRGSVNETRECPKHNKVLLVSSGCVVGALFGPLLLPFALGAVVATVVHHEFETGSEKEVPVVKKTE